MSEDASTAAILKQLATVLEPAGYRQQGRTFVSDRDEVVLFVRLRRLAQPGGGERRLPAAYVLELGTLLKELAHRLGQPTHAPRLTDAHWRDQLGWLLPEYGEDHWVVHDRDGARAAGEEMTAVVQRYVLPALERMSTTVGLVTTWATAGEAIREHARRAHAVDHLDASCERFVQRLRRAGQQSE